jgi:hypothetical protein
MTLTPAADRLEDSIHQQLDRARTALIHARSEQRRKDTPAARARVQACLATMDAVLDMWNATTRVAD